YARLLAAGCPAAAVTDAASAKPFINLQFPISQPTDWKSLDHNMRVIGSNSQSAAVMSSLHFANSTFHGFLRRLGRQFASKEARGLPTGASARRGVEIRRRVAG